jgi:hypothetical protein
MIQRDECTHKGKKIWRNKYNTSSMNQWRLAAICICARCRAYLPLGKARDSVQAQIELRAAELAALMNALDAEEFFRTRTELELLGMTIARRDLDAPLDPHVLAGWLCWQIAGHDDSTVP